MNPFEEGTPVPPAPAEDYTMKVVPELRAQLENQKSLKKGWDSYRADPPNEVAINNTNAVLDTMEKHHLDATAVTPDACGGIMISWQSFRKYAHIECENNGAVTAAVADNEDETAFQCWYVSELHIGPIETDEISLLTLPELLEYIRTFFWARYD